MKAKNKSIATLLFILFFPGMTVAEPKRLEYCTKVSMAKGGACNNNPESVRLTINADQCQMNVFAKACFEKKDGSWGCEAEEIFEKEGDYNFDFCQGTGNYVFDICGKGKDGYECGYEPSGSFLAHTCTNGKGIEYKVDVLAKGIFKLMLKNRKPIVLNQRHTAKNGAYFVSANDVSNALCGEAVKADASKALIHTLKSEISKAVSKKITVCMERNSESICRKQLIGIPEKTAVIGVRG